MSKSANNPCPLCQSTDIEPFAQDKKRNYLLCCHCQLVFVPQQQFLSRDKEKARYAQHNNSPEDLSYRNFLSRIFTPLDQRLMPASEGLDFGSGPGPTLSLIFAEAGYKMSIYDCFFADNPAVWRKQYDFITATEVVEHLHRPAKELNRLWNCLKPGGWLGIMTKQRKSLEDFKHWHYKNDLTHVCFFSPRTMTWLANGWNAKLEWIEQDIVLLHKPLS